MAQLEQKKAIRTPKQECGAVYRIHSKSELEYAFFHCKVGNILKVDYELFRLMRDNCGTVELHVVAVHRFCIEFKTVWPDLRCETFFEVDARLFVHRDNKRWFFEMEDDLRWQIKAVLGARQKWLCA